MSKLRGMITALFLSAVAIAALGGTAVLASDTHHTDQRVTQSVQDCDPQLTPNQGPAGTLVAGRFIDNLPLFEFNVYWQTPGQPDVFLAHGNADMNGVGLFSFTVPSGASDGPHNVLTRGVSNTNCTFIDIFTVGPAPVTPPPPTIPVPPTVAVPVATPTVAAPAAGNAGSSGFELRDATPAAAALLLFGITCFILAMSRRPRPMVVFTSASRPSQELDRPVQPQEPATDETVAHAPKRGALVASAAVVAGAIAVWFSRKR